MSFETSWLTDGDSAPESAAGRAVDLRAFLHDDPSADDAAALAAADLEGLCALAAVLEGNRDGRRLALLREAGLPKKARKAVGKAIHRLESRGVEVKAGAPRGGSVGYNTDPLPSYLSVPLPNGAQLLLLSGRAFGRHLTAYAVTTDEGLEELAAIEDTSRTRLRQMIGELTHDGRLGLEMYMVEAPAAVVRERLRSAVQRHRDRGKPMPEDWPVCAEIVDHGDAWVGTHPVYELVPEVDASLVRLSAELLGGIRDSGDHDSRDHDSRDHDSGERDSGERDSGERDSGERDAYHPGLADRPIFSHDWQAAANQRLKNAVESPIVIDDDQRRDRVLDELDRLVDDSFDEDMREASARRLVETAYTLQLSGRSEQASIALATAHALADSARAPIDIPWCKESVHGIVDVDMVLEGRFPHVHGHDCDFHDHGHDHASHSADAGDREASPIILPGDA